MDRHFVRALLYAWNRPEFRSGLQHLIDLDEVTTLLTALSEEGHDQQVEREAMELLRSALDTDEIRRAVLLLIEDPDIRQQLSAGLTDALPDRPRLAAAIRSALEDVRVRRDVHAALESAHVRGLVWRAAENQFGGHRLALIGQVLVLLGAHRSVRRLVWALRRHGVLRQLRAGADAVPQP